MKRLINYFRRLWLAIRRQGVYVIADSTDNSVTLSRRLFRHLHVMEQEQAKVYVFTVKGSASRFGREVYAFMLNPPIQQETHLADIQYNDKHKCIGFECLVPTVNRIFYDYGIPHHTKVKLSVLPTPVGINGTIHTIYQIIPPHGKRSHNHPQA